MEAKREWSLTARLIREYVARDGARMGEAWCAWMERQAVKYEMAAKMAAEVLP